MEINDITIIFTMIVGVVSGLLALTFGGVGIILGIRIIDVYMVKRVIEGESS
ncbi:hypothetical protein ACFWDG_16265 [Peribacillus sp. NPDC060186]